MPTGRASFLKIAAEAPRPGDRRVNRKTSGPIARSQKWAPILDKKLILDTKLKGKQLCPEECQITENNSRGSQARKSSTHNNKLIGKHQCQEDGQIPENDTGRPGPDVVDS